MFFLDLTLVIELDSLVLGSSESNSALVKSNQGRIWTTFIECVSATGVALDPAIIFKGKSLQSQWFLEEFKKIADWSFITSENGWTDNDIAISWLENVYLPQTTPLLTDPSDARLLILDGHKSHTSVFLNLPEIVFLLISLLKPWLTS